MPPPQNLQQYLEFLCWWHMVDDDAAIVAHAGEDECIRRGPGGGIDAVLMVAVRLDQTIHTTAGGKRYTQIAGSEQISIRLA